MRLLKVGFLGGLDTFVFLFVYQLFLCLRRITTLRIMTIIKILTIIIIITMMIMMITVAAMVLVRLKSY